MASQRANQPSWILDTKLFPHEIFTSHERRPDEVIMVDVGGGAGHQCIALRQAHPDLHGRVILQDLPDTIAMTDRATLQNSGTEALAHDFMTPQPIKGARVYYMRNVLHDWPDNACLTILKHLRNAMSAESVLVVDEIVVSDSGSGLRQINFDLVMTSVFGAMERTEDQWKALLSSAN